jgi:hypothetical protein
VVASIALAGPALWWMLLGDEEHKDEPFYLHPREMALMAGRKYFTIVKKAVRINFQVLKFFNGSSP